MSSIGQAVEALAPPQLGPLVGGGCRRPRLHLLVEVGDVLHPAAVGLELGQVVLELLVAVEPARDEVDGDASPGPTRPFSTTSVSTSGTIPVSEPTTRRPSPCASSASAAGRCGPCRRRPSASRWRRSRPAVPGLQDAVAVAEQVAVLGLHRDPVRPGRRDQHGLDQRQLAAGADQGLADRVERGAVGAARLDERLHVLVVLAERPATIRVSWLRIQLTLPRSVLISPLCERAERLRQLPGRAWCWSSSAGGTARTRDEALVLQAG